MTRVKKRFRKTPEELLKGLLALTIFSNKRGEKSDDDWLRCQAQVEDFMLKFNKECQEALQKEKNFSEAHSCEFSMGRVAETLTPSLTEFSGVPEYSLPLYPSEDYREEG